MADRLPGPGHFTDGRPPLGEGALTLEVGGLAVRLEGIPGDLARPLAERYRPFLSEAQPLHTVRLEAGEEAYLEFVPNTFLRLEEREADGGRALFSHDFAAWRSGPRGFLRLSVPGDVKASLQAVENYLRWVVADLALARGGFIFHAAGLVKEGRARVFFGPSGAGKSTVVSLSEGLTILSDDLVLLLEGQEGWFAATTPFAGTLPQQAKDRAVYPLAGLFRLTQAPAHELRAVPLHVAVGMVAACCPFVTDPALRHDRLLPLVEACCRSTGVRELRFRKDPGFWPLLG